MSIMHMFNVHTEYNIQFIISIWEFDNCHYLPILLFKSLFMKQDQFNNA